ncbi:hypothetical protein H2200_009445 [Cladophialophora chaetospira]|uniref:BZIP domain-containing protein n=1 Tax=Cladophialophora chaetospira TaxID=386627 RepID=A0AA38X448_9EURO|nr:hypothetical protein H2200_009445 [Cladophialophora chaetospira]
MSPNLADDSTPLESPLDFVPEIFGSPGDSLRLMRTDSSLQGSPSAEIECPNNGRCASQQIPCDVCQRDKRERRKEQNRKAQRNHRLRSEAKLELLRAKVKTQADEIVMLRDFNQSLMKHIETIESKGKDEGARDAGGQEADATLQDMSGSP